MLIYIPTLANVFCQNSEWIGHSTLKTSLIYAHIKLLFYLGTLGNKMHLTARNSKARFEIIGFHACKATKPFTYLVHY